MVSRRLPSFGRPDRRYVTPRMLSLLCAAVIAALLAGTSTTRADPAAEARTYIDRAGNAINRQIGDWIGSPDTTRPSTDSKRRTAPAPTAAASKGGDAPPVARATASIPLPLPRPPEAGGQRQTAQTDTTNARASTPATSAPEASKDAETSATLPAPEVAAQDAVAAPPAEEPSAPPFYAASTPAPSAKPATARLPAQAPLPPPAPERRLAALPATASPEVEEAPAATAVPTPASPVESRGEEASPTICPELSGEDIGIFTPTVVTATNAACTVDRGVNLTAVRMRDGRLVKLEPAAVLRCAMAASVANWLRNSVEPAIDSLGAPLSTVLVAASQQCRPRNRVPGAKISEHGRGNAIDIRGFVLEDGRRFVIGAPMRGQKETAMPVAFQESLKASACADFTTILGPGSDGYHELHLHVDRAERRNNLVLCRWAIARKGTGVSSQPDAKPSKPGTGQSAPLPPPSPMKSEAPATP